MQVQSNPNPGVNPRNNAPTPQPPQPPAPQGDRFSFHSAAGGVGGAVVGVAGSLVSAVAVGGVARLIGSIASAALPSTGVLVPSLVLTVAQGAVLGAVVLGAGAGLAAGASVAYQACNGAQQLDAAKIDPKARGPQNNKHQESAADLRANLKDMGNAASFGGAIGHGFQAGAALGGSVGAAAGKVQGALLGFAVGGLAGLPLLRLIDHPAVLIPTAILGGMLGAKIGEPLGYAAGAVVAGGVGAAAGTLCHAGQKLTGH